MKISNIRTLFESFSFIYTTMWLGEKVRKHQTSWMKKDHSLALTLFRVFPHRILSLCLVWWWQVSELFSINLHVFVEIKHSDGNRPLMAYTKNALVCIKFNILNEWHQQINDCFCACVVRTIFFNSFFTFLLTCRFYQIGKITSFDDI